VAETSIEWTATQAPDGTMLPGYTMNFWIGCTKVSPACDHCYAERYGNRFGVQWGNHPRRRTSEANWRKPLAWNARAKKLGVRLKVFTNSLADFFDNQIDSQWRYDAWGIIWQCENLDWLILTKRPQNIANMMPRYGGRWPWSNVWLGTTVENQEEMAKRRRHLLYVPAAVHFLSCEPLLGRVWLPSPDTYSNSISWVICGGESGPGKRPMDLAWARALRDECAELSIPFFMKQVDKVQPVPDDLMIRQMPVVEART
jgi:protein gp37